MKNVVLMMISMMLGMLTLMLAMTMYGRITRSMELKSNLASVTEETLENMALNPKYSIQNTNELLADFVEALILVVDARSDITVKILQCDKEKGILSVKVELTYLHPNGKSGMVSCEKTVILNQTCQTSEADMCKVLFYVEDEVYKEYQVTEGSVVNAPAEPQNEDNCFYGWVDVNGYLADFTQPVEHNLVFYADMR